MTDILDYETVFNVRERPNDYSVLDDEDECLNEHLFDSLRHARQLIAAWRDDYNPHRPHTSLNGLTPRDYATRSLEDHDLHPGLSPFIS